AAGGWAGAAYVGPRPGGGSGFTCGGSPRPLRAPGCTSGSLRSRLSCLPVCSPRRAGCRDGDGWSWSRFIGGAPEAAPARACGRRDAPVAAKGRERTAAAGPEDGGAGAPGRARGCARGGGGGPGPWPGAEVWAGRRGPGRRRAGGGGGGGGAGGGGGGGGGAWSGRDVAMDAGTRTVGPAPCMARKAD